MRIKSILLYNFGSYEGKTFFDTHTTNNGNNIILIGGKNGAGKTTLFTAIRLCLYGHKSMGYKNINSYYNRSIIKLLNNNAKLQRPAHSYVEMQIELSNGHEIDVYTLHRAWILDEVLTEKFYISKNSISLTEIEISDFEKYLLSLLPPELFNLYFFDGEKIADFFLEEGSNSRIKDAFLTLCGYDTFEIMRKNFKRIGVGKTDKSPDLSAYLVAKETLESKKQIQSDLMNHLKQCVDEIVSCESEIVALDKNYHQSGGVSEEEWNQRLNIIKEEEKKRETYNALLKKWANEIIPFLMVRDQIYTLKKQIEKENKAQKFHNFKEVLTNPIVKNLVNGDLSVILEAASAEFSGSKKVILDLSLEQSVLLLAHINKILNFDITKVVKYKSAIKRSISQTAKIRQELEHSNITSVQEYMQQRAKLFETKSLLLVQRLELERQLTENRDELLQAESELSRIKIRFENELKQASIKDISARAIIMLDKLQQTLYTRQIKKVEEFFRKEIKILMRKTNFIDDIPIDTDLNIPIFRTDKIEVKRLRAALRTNTHQQVIAMIGNVAYQYIQNLSAASDSVSIIQFFKNFDKDKIMLPLEIDKTSLSNGEKQIFIMALYHSLIQLCNHEIPFVIDTPFARIDTEHRKNISTHFFSKLKGQVFILSTNEEINLTHMQILKDKIAATYMLENTNDKQTVVINNKYFEV